MGPDRTQSWNTRAMRAPAFAGMTDSDVARLLAGARLVQIRDDQLLFSRGDEARIVYLVLSGAIRISTTGANGKRITVEIFQAGDLLGEIAPMDGGTRTADATAMGPAELVAIPVATFLEVLTGSAALANTLLRTAIARLRRTYTLLEDASLRTLESRFARQVLYLAKLGFSGQTQIRLQARMHQDELADLLGVTTRSIINVLNKWRDEELVSFDGRAAQLTILDIERFRSLTEE